MGTTAYVFLNKQGQHQYFSVKKSSLSGVITVSDEQKCLIYLVMIIIIN